MCNSVGMLTGSMHLTESAHKLPRELIIPSDRLHLLDSIGQGEPGVYILHSHSTMYINHGTTVYFFANTTPLFVFASNSFNVVVQTLCPPHTFYTSLHMHDDRPKSMCPTY